MSTFIILFTINIELMQSKHFSWSLALAIESVLCPSFFFLELKYISLFNTLQVYIFISGLFCHCKKKSEFITRYVLAICYTHISLKKSNSKK
jgi:hypothetical protein